MDERFLADAVDSPGRPDDHTAQRIAVAVKVFGGAVDHIVGP